MQSYDSFLRNMKDKDYILIKLKDEWPFFAEKVFVKDGKTRTESNYHIADGMFSTYINYEMPNNSISAEISGPIAFEISGTYDCPVYVMNSGKELMYIRVTRYVTSTWPLNPGEVAAIYPEGEAKAEEDMVWEMKLQKRYPEEILTQEEMNSLLMGIPFQRKTGEDDMDETGRNGE